MVEAKRFARHIRKPPNADGAHDRDAHRQRVIGENFAFGLKVAVLRRRHGPEARVAPNLAEIWTRAEAVERNAQPKCAERQQNEEERRRALA